MSVGRNIPPKGNHIVIEVNEYEASLIAGALSLYIRDIIKNVALVAAINDEGKALAMKRLLTPEVERVLKMVKEIEEDEKYTSASFDKDEVKKLQDDFERVRDNIQFLLSDGQDGTAPEGTTGPDTPDDPNVGGNVVAFKKKSKLH